MRWRVVLEVVGADGTRQVHEVGAGERPPAGHSAATLGLGLEEGKATLAGVQRHLIAAQVEEHCRSRRRCDRCGAQRPLHGQLSAFFPPSVRTMYCRVTVSISPSTPCAPASPPRSPP